MLLRRLPINIIQVGLHIYVLQFDAPPLQVTFEYQCCLGYRFALLLSSGQVVDYFVVGKVHIGIVLALSHVGEVGQPELVDPDICEIKHP